jgi:hypothetical protein
LPMISPIAWFSITISNTCPKTGRPPEVGRGVGRGVGWGVGLGVGDGWDGWDGDGRAVGEGDGAAVTSGDADAGREAGGTSVGEGSSEVTTAAWVSIGEADGDGVDAHADTAGIAAASTRARPRGMRRWRSPRSASRVLRVRESTDSPAHWHTLGRRPRSSADRAAAF